MFDINGDGVISAFELRAGMNSLGKEMSMDEAEEVIELLDEKGKSLVDISKNKCEIKPSNSQELNRSIPMSTKISRHY